MLERTYPHAVTALEYANAFELLIAVILSAQCTDARVNLTTPRAVRARIPTRDALGAAEAGRRRADHQVVRLLSHEGEERHRRSRGIVARARRRVAARPRVARSAARASAARPRTSCMSVAFEEAAFAVDTHVFRVAHRLGLTLATTPRGVEDDVTKLVPREKWRHAHHWLILHGRAICKAPIPQCGRCPVTMCPSRAIVARCHGAAGSDQNRSGPGSSRCAGRGSSASSAIVLKSFEPVSGSR